MRRRRVIAAAPGLACWPAALRAQAIDKPWRIAFLGAGAAPLPGQFSSFDAIQAGLRERGYTALQTRRPGSATAASTRCPLWRSRCWPGSPT